MLYMSTRGLEPPGGGAAVRNIDITNVRDGGAAHLGQVRTDARIVEQSSRGLGRMSIWKKLTGLWLNAEEW